jgi:hypothetical protein
MQTDADALPRVVRASPARPYDIIISVLLLLQNLDGPYVAFVGSMKLEGAYLAISQRDVEAEAEEARLGQMQEFVRKKKMWDSRNLWIQLKGSLKSLQGMERRRTISRRICL